MRFYLVGNAGCVTKLLHLRKTNQYDARYSVVRF